MEEFIFFNSKRKIMSTQYYAFSFRGGNTLRKTQADKKKKNRQILRINEINKIAFSYREGRNQEKRGGLGKWLIADCGQYSCSYIDSTTSCWVCRNLALWGHGRRGFKDYEVNDHNYQWPCGRTRCGWRLYLQSYCSRNQGLGVGVMLTWVSPKRAVEIEIAVNLISS